MDPDSTAKALDHAQRGGLPAILAERLGTHASARVVYGEPVVVGEKTVLPVARVLWGFGGGSGMSRGRPEGLAASGTHARLESGPSAGEGGGGGMIAVPVGVVEITPDRTRFLPFRPWLPVAAGVAAGFLLGLGVARRRRAP